MDCGGRVAVELDGAFALFCANHNPLPVTDQNGNQKWARFVQWWRRTGRCTTAERNSRSRFKARESLTVSSYANKEL